MSLKCPLISCVAATRQEPAGIVISVLTLVGGLVVIAVSLTKGRRGS